MNPGSRDGKPDANPLNYGAAYVSTYFDILLPVPLLCTCFFFIIITVMALVS
jgi:hypothetical protein